MERWFKNSYARLLIDNHITEDDPSFMSRFDPAVYVDMVKKAGVDSAMVYATCHNGNCYYPTKVGHMHANLKGRDIFGEVIAGLNAAKIVPIAYYTAIYHNRAAQEHPAWRIIHPTGDDHGGRYWFSCPNSKDYREFVKQQLAEIIAYPVRGIFIDMTFWPGLCVCPNCRQKFGAEFPAKLDWNDPAWVRFQRFREASLEEYAAELTAFVKSRRDISVTHQGSPYLAGWKLGQRHVAAACDYMSGDFYGGKAEHVIGAKAFAAASKDLPFEFMTSRCPNLMDHTSTKSAARMRCEAATTLAAGGAYFFIDAINPDGTLDPTVYETFGAVTTALAPFVRAARELRPAPAADTALYWSPVSLMDPADNGRTLRDAEENASGKPVMQECLGWSRALAAAHIPFRVVTDQDKQFPGVRSIICPSVRFLSAAEAQRLRAFVAAGGTLLATGLTSLQGPDGATTGEFALADVLGVSYAGKESAAINYLDWTEGPRLVSCHSPAPLVKATAAQVIARITEPLFTPNDPEHYASIHSNPPGRRTEFAGLTINNFGKGKAVYLAPPVLDRSQQDAQLEFGMGLCRTYTPSGIVVETNAPAAVEVTVLKSTVRHSRLVSLVNWQHDLPNIPVRDITLALALPGNARPVRCTRVSDGQPQGYMLENGILRMTVPVVETMEMVRIDF